jgi:endo-beta-N-acetylglucosaminidase D
MTKQRLLTHFAHGLRFRLSLALSLTISMVVSMAWAGEVPTQPATTIQPDQPPFALTLAQLKSWSTQSPLAAADNVSQQPLVRRFVAPLARNSSAVVQDHQARVLYAPDGMNNFANYLTAQPKFNLYNFTHWAQIDVLNWFAGTADLTVQIPARPWVDTAHKNGVKVIGSVFLGIAQWGGNPDTVEMLLQQDAEGRFVMAHQLVALAQYYGFDGSGNRFNCSQRCKKSVAERPKGSKTRCRTCRPYAELYAISDGNCSRWDGNSLV